MPELGWLGPRRGGSTSTDYIVAERQGRRVTMSARVLLLSAGRSGSAAVQGADH